MMRAIIATCVLCPVLALADAWPSWLSPNVKAHERGNEALSGAVERLTVVAGPNAWTNYITTNIWASYFSQWSKCQAAKNMLKAAVDTPYYNETSGLGVRWVEPVTNWNPGTAVKVTATGLLTKIGAPADWWTNTPRFALAVATNGWRFIPAAMSNVTTYQESWDLLAASNGVAITWLSFFPTGATVEARYNEALAQTPAVTNTPGGGGSEAVVIDIVGGYIYLWRASSDRYWSWGDTQSPHITNTAAVVETWLLASEYNDAYGTLAFFDAQTDSVTNAWVRQQSWTRAKGVTNGPSFRLGDSGDTNAPPNYGSIDDDDGGMQGWTIDPYVGALGGNETFLHKFSATTNGFKWFR
jgi:hypothetical protein